MEKFIINGGIPLQGEVEISGAKNAALAIIPAAILSQDVCVIENLPVSISDVNYMMKILKQIGAGVKLINKNTIEIDSRHVDSYVISHDMTKHHYSQAVKMENIGMFDKAERLIVKVALDESDRNLKSAENQNQVLKNALYTIIGLRDNKSTSQQVGQQVDKTNDKKQNNSTTTSLFLNEQYPSLDWFKDMMRKNSYVYKQSELHDDISKNTLRMSRSNYFPVISVFGKQTIASYHVPNNLIPNTVGGINLAWDIFDGLARERNIQMTKIESEIISETQQNLKNELEVAVDEWHANLKQAVVNAKDLQSSLDLAEEVYKIRKKSFAEGLCTSQQVLDALNLLNKTKLLLLTTYFEYDIALANLCCLCGIPEYFEAFINE